MDRGALQGLANNKALVMSAVLNAIYFKKTVKKRCLLAALFGVIWRSNHPFNVASMVMSAFNTLETGQFALAVSAAS